MSKSLIYKLSGLSIAILAMEAIGLNIAIAGNISGKIFQTFGVADLPVTFLLQIAAFGGLALLLHGVIALYAWLSAKALEAVLRLSSANTNSLCLMIFLASWAAIFLANNALFPSSLFAYWGKFTFGPFDQLSIAALSALLALLPAPIIAYWVLRSWHRNWVLGGMVAAILGILAFGPVLNEMQTRTSDRPNLIVIGVDSYRSEYLQSHQVMPVLSAELEDAALFSEVYTPLARTFPSWTSMLTGLHPLESGARINLLDPKLIKRDAMLTWALRDAGYHTMLATDERRFSNLDESYGFDTVFGPKAGAADFVLGKVGDLPIVNLLAASDFGGFLFPYLHNNRAVSRLYRPDHFAKRLGRAVSDVNSQPLFLMTHLCLPHWPYDWADSPRIPPQKNTRAHEMTKKEKAEWKRKNNELRRVAIYESALSAADRQIEILLDSLRESGHLDNALLVFITDHGEALGLQSDALVDPGDILMPSTTRITTGHGTNLFAIGQNRTFMAFKRYGGTDYVSGVRSQRFQSVDFKPTVLELLQISDPGNASAISMMPWLLDPGQSASERPFFLETGFYLPAIDSVAIDVNELLAQGSSYYVLDENGNLVINPDEVETLINNKQRGILRGAHLLGQVPSRATGGKVDYQWVLADINGGNTVKLDAENFATACPDFCVSMLQEMEVFYGEELQIEQWEAYAAYKHAGNLALITRPTPKG